MVPGLGFALASHLVVTRFGLGTASRFCLLTKHRSGVRIHRKPRLWLPQFRNQQNPAAEAMGFYWFRDLDSNQD